MTTPRIQDDLYHHVNGEWLATHEIPADRPSDGVFRQLRDRSEEQVRAIIDDAIAGRVKDEDAQRIAGLYTSFMDTGTIERRGLSAASADLDSISGATSKTSLAKILGALAPTGIASPFDFGVSNDPNDPDTYTLYMLQGGLGLPDEAYYREEQHAQTREAYRAHVARMLQLANFGSDAEADRILAFETALAAHHWNIVDMRDPVKTNNPMTLDELDELAGEFPLRTWSISTGTPEMFTSLHVMTPSFFEGLSQVWAATSLEDLILWAKWHALHDRSPFLSDAFSEETFNFYGRTLTGAQQQRERWKRGVAFVDGAISEGVGRIYVDRHFPPEAKEAMDHLVDRLIEAYRRSITNLEWLSDTSKTRALEKLDAFYPKIGYPNSWRDYQSLMVDPSDLVGNVRTTEMYEWNRQAAKVGKPVDREEWMMPPQMVNAYYMPTTNEIAFPAAILQPPFFSVDADDAANYGGIGAVIGHEIGHGFDDQGSHYGPTGKLEDWWTPEDRAAFEDRTKALIEQYDGLVPAQLSGDEHSVNGALTIGENIGDLGGLSIAIKAYGIELESRGSSFTLEPEIDGKSALARLFINWALVWREKARDEYLIQRMATDPHSPDEFRANETVKNIDAFHETFNVQPGDGMWRRPEDRVTIW